MAFNEKKVTAGLADAEVFTTKHWIHGMMIQKLWRDYKGGAKSSQPVIEADASDAPVEAVANSPAPAQENRLAAINEVDSNHEVTNQIKSKSEEPAEPEQQQVNIPFYVRPQMSSENEISLDEGEFDDNGFTAFHNDKKNLGK